MHVHLVDQLPPVGGGVHQIPLIPPFLCPPCVDQGFNEFVLTPMDGFMGLSQDWMYGEGTGTPFYQKLYEEGQIREPVFSIFYSQVSPGKPTLTRCLPLTSPPLSPSQNDASPGQLLFGGIDPALLSSPMAWHPPGPSSPTYWSLVVERIEVSGIETWSCTSGSSSCREAMVDSGSSRLVVPQELLPNEESFDIGWDCVGIADLPSLSLYIRTVEGELRNYTMFGSEYTLKQNGSDVGLDPDKTYCVSGIAGAPGERVTGKTLANMVILGNTFIRKFYTAFDFGAGVQNGRIGFGISQQDWLPPPSPSPTSAPSPASVTGTDELNITIVENDVTFADNEDDAENLQKQLTGTAETVSKSSVTIANSSALDNATVVDTLANGSIISGDLENATYDFALSSAAIDEKNATLTLTQLT
jgi:hypothetical protein